MTSSLTRATRMSAPAAVAAACALLTACGSTAAPGAASTRTVTVQASAGGSTSGPAPASSPAASPAVQAPPTCLASRLQAGLGVSQGAAGTMYQVIVLTNTSSATCTLYGYPGVSFVTGLGGSQIGKPASKNPLVAKTLVTLMPGAKADVLLAVHDAGAYGCKIISVHWLRIYPPGDFDSIFLHYDTQACAGRSTTSVTAVRVGAGSASY